MADPGVIALDPARLHGLEAYLQGLGDGCRRRAGRVADAVDGSGVAATHPITQLDRLALQWHRERDEVAWRRALVEALGHELPLPARLFADPADERAAAAALADRVHDAIDGGPPRWERLSALLAELDRHRRSERFGAAFFLALGGRRARELPLWLERAGSAAGVDPAAVLAVQTGLGDALRRASHVDDGALTEAWIRRYLDVPAGVAAPDPPDDTGPDEPEAAAPVEAALQRAGWGATVAGWMATAVRQAGTAVVLGAAGGAIGVVRAPLALDDGDGLECDGPQAVTGAVASGLSLVGATAGPAGAPVVAAGMVLTGLSLLFSACEAQPARPNETTRRVDPETGQDRLPSGHPSNPHVDGAGVPLPPSYG